VVYGAEEAWWGLLRQWMVKFASFSSRVFHRQELISPTVVVQVRHSACARERYS